MSCSTEHDALFTTDPEGIRRSFLTIEGLLAQTWERARRLTDEQRQERVDGEWSVVETIRHMVFVVDAWISRTVLRETDPYHPITLPHDEFDGTLPGVDRDAKPSFDEALGVWEGRLATVRKIVENLDNDELYRHITTEGPGYPEAGHETQVIGPLWSFFNEMWFHNRYMNRDIDVIEGRSAS